jgi:hypothetical protein
MSDNDELSSKLSIEPDKSSFAASNREIDKLLSGIDDLTKGTTDLDKAQKKNTETAKQARKAYRDLAAEAKKATDEANRARQASVDRTSNAFGKASTGVGSIASVAGGIGGSAAGEGLRLAGDVAGAAEQIPALASGIAALGPVALVAGAAAVGLALALGQTIDQQNKLREATKARLDAEVAVLTFVQNATREQADARKKQLQEEYELQSGIYQQRLAQYLEEFDQLNGLDRARLQVGLAYGEIAELGTSAEAAGKAADKAWQELLLLEEQLRANATAANDMALAEQELATKRQSFVDDMLNRQIQLVLQADDLTLESAQKRRESLLNDRVVYEELLATAELTTAQYEKYDLLLKQTNADISTLNYLLIPQIEAREKEAKAIDAVRKSIADTISAAGKTISILAEQSGAIRKVNDDLARELGQAASERNKALVDAEREATEGRLEAVQEREKSLRDNAIEAADQRLKIEEDYQKSVRASQRRFARTSIDAISERDVLAFLQAKQARDDEIRDAKETRAEGLRDVNVQLRKQNQAVIERYNEQLVAVATRLNEQTRVIAERYNEQVRAANEAAQREIQTIRTKYAQELQVIQQGAAASISAAGSFWNGMANLARNALSSVTAASKSATTNPLLKLLGFAKGGYPPTDRPSLVGENGPELIQPRVPSRVYSNQQTQRMMAGGAGNGINIPISVSGVGMGIPQIEKAVIDKLHEALVMVVGD